MCKNSTFSCSIVTFEVSNDRGMEVDINFNEKWKMVADQKGDRNEKDTSNGLIVTCEQSKDIILDVGNYFKEKLKILTGQNV